MPRDQFVSLRISDAEHERLKMEADVRGLPLSSYVRARILAGPDDQANHEAIQKLTALYEDLAGVVGQLSENLIKAVDRVERLEALAQGSDY